MYTMMLDNNTNMLYSSMISIEKKLEFITNFSAHGNKTRACKETGLNYHTFLYHIEHDEEFRKRLRLAHESLTDQVEETLLKQATNPKAFKHTKLWLEAHRPDKYSPKVKHTVETKDERLLGLLDKAKGYDKVMNAQLVQGSSDVGTLVNTPPLAKDEENQAS